MRELFNGEEWFNVREARRRTMFEEIKSLDECRLLNTSLDTLCQYFEDKNAVEVPSLLREETTVATSEVERIVNDYGEKRRITATLIDVNVPFTGPSGAFYIRPSTYFSGAPDAFIANNILHFSVSGEYGPEHIKREIDHALNVIDRQLNSLRTNVDEFQKQVARDAREWIEQRRTKVLADKNMVASLGYKLKPRQGAATTFAPPQVRRKLTPRLPPVGTTPFKPEPALPTEDYEIILSLLSNMASVMERDPAAFAMLDEEALRSHFLVPLNSYYEGSATGETFNHEGKTDILIRVDGRNIFIAECKFWRGAKELIATIDQLLSYASWRDTKTAIILFNKNKNFSKVLASIAETMPAHTNYLRLLGSCGESGFRYVFSHPSDANREMFVTVLAFDVPRE